jgi:hypothetical protein
MDNAIGWPNVTNRKIREFAEVRFQNLPNFDSENDEIRQGNFTAALRRNLETSGRAKKDFPN